MQFLRFIKILMFVTVLSLVYIHLQIRIIGLAYDGKEKEKGMRQLAEVNGHLKYKILALTSSNHLGVKMLSENSKMEFMGSQDIVQVSYVSQHPVIQGSETEKSKKPLLSLLSFAKEAEANGQE